MPGTAAQSSAVPSSDVLVHVWLKGSVRAIESARGPDWTMASAAVRTPAARRIRFIL
jgi:hypothetical protein